MRALFGCWPGKGHFLPVVPLARAWSAAGRQAAFASATRSCRRVVQRVDFQMLEDPAGRLATSGRRL